MSFLAPPFRVPWASWAEWAEMAEAVSFFIHHSSELDITNIAVLNAGAYDRPFPVELLPVAAEYGRRIDRISCLWRSRGRLPLVVDASCSLLQHPFRDYLCGIAHLDSRSDSSTAFSVRVVLLHTVSRLVSGLSDSGQRGVASSIASVAARRGVGRVAVDIRHESAHGEMPCLPLAQGAARAMLAWLGAHYWGPQGARLGQVLEMRVGSSRGVGGEMGLGSGVDSTIGGVGVDNDRCYSNSNSSSSRGSTDSSTLAQTQASTLIPGQHAVVEGQHAQVMAYLQVALLNKQQPEEQQTLHALLAKMPTAEILAMLLKYHVKDVETRLSKKKTANDIGRRMLAECGDVLRLRALACEKDPRRKGIWLAQCFIASLLNAICRHAAVGGGVERNSAATAAAALLLYLAAGNAKVFGQLYPITLGAAAPHVANCRKCGIPALLTVMLSKEYLAYAASACAKQDASLDLNDVIGAMPPLEGCNMATLPTVCGGFPLAISGAKRSRHDRDKGSDDKLEREVTILMALTDVLRVASKADPMRALSEKILTIFGVPFNASMPIVSGAAQTKARAMVATEKVATDKMGLDDFEALLFGSKGDLAEATPASPTGVTASPRPRWRLS